MRGKKAVSEIPLEAFRLLMLVFVVSLFGVACSSEKFGTIDSQTSPNELEEEEGSEDEDLRELEPDEAKRAELDEYVHACDDDRKHDDRYEYHNGANRVDLDNIESSSIVVDLIRVHGDFGLSDDEAPMEFRIEERELDLLALSPDLQLLIDETVVDPLSVSDISKIRLNVKEARVKPISENEIDLTIPSEMLRIVFDDDIDSLEEVRIDVSGHFKRLPTGDMKFVPPVICVDVDDDHHSGSFFDRFFRF
jgi:hypothetical protein